MMFLIDALKFLELLDLMSIDKFNLGETKRFCQDHIHYSYPRC